MGCEQGVGDPQALAEGIGVYGGADALVGAHRGVEQPQHVEVVGDEPNLVGAVGLGMDPR